MKVNRRIILQLALGYTLSTLMSKQVYASKMKNLFKQQKIKIALLGLGDYAENWIAPAIAESKYAELTSIITGSPHKIPKWKKRYQIKDKNIYDYKNMDHIIENDSLLVYVVTPTGTHTSFTVQAYKLRSM